MLLMFFFKWSIPSMITDDDKFFQTSFLEGFMG
jgi:hypothetical protein